MIVGSFLPFFLVFCLYLSLIGTHLNFSPSIAALNRLSGTMVRVSDLPSLDDTATVAFA